MDIKSLPETLRFAIRDILEIACDKPFCNHNEWVAKTIYEYAQTHQIYDIVELGAGNGPITRKLIKMYPEWNASFIVTDLKPDQSVFEELSRLDKRIVPHFEPVDITQDLPSGKKLFILSSSFHHVPDKLRSIAMKNFVKNSQHVLFFECLPKRIINFLMIPQIFIPGILAPLFCTGRPNFLRTVFWCWCIPIAPLMLVWDGWVSWFRIWNNKKWKENCTYVSFKTKFLSSLVICHSNEIDKYLGDKVQANIFRKII